MIAETTLALILFATVIAFVCGQAQARREERKQLRRRRERLRAVTREELR